MQEFKCLDGPMKDKTLKIEDHYRYGDTVRMRENLPFEIRPFHEDLLDWRLGRTRPVFKDHLYWIDKDGLRYCKVQ